MPAEFSGGTQSEIVNGNRSAPGDSGKPESDEDEQQGANGVEVHDRFQLTRPSMRAVSSPSIQAVRRA